MNGKSGFGCFGDFRPMLQDGCNPLANAYVRGCQLDIALLEKNFNRGDTEYHGGHPIEGVMPSPY